MIQENIQRKEIHFVLGSQNKTINSIFTKEYIERGYPRSKMTNFITGILP